MKFINPLVSLPHQLFYHAKKKYSPLNKNKRENHIIVSLTSFPPRLDTLHYTLKSILSQSMKPDSLLLYLAKEEISDDSGLPSTILDLKKYGLEIIYVNDNLKPHKKYYYAMKHYPNSIIITIDDDVIYNKNLIRDLYNSYLKYPLAVSAKRVHKMLKDENNNLVPYDEWLYEYKKETIPSFDLITTGVGGVLFPPGILPDEAFDMDKITEFCLNADDIWLKFMELKNNIPVAWVKGHKIHPYIIRRTQKVSLQKSNYHDNQNDKYITALQDHYGVKLATFLTDSSIINRI